MTAYKFLRAGAVGPFSGFRWPTGEPGAWVEAEPHVCSSGVHACRAEDLPYWLDTELWEIELERHVEERRKLVAPRGRLLRRVRGWDAAAAADFARACAARTASGRYPQQAADAAGYAASGHAATAAFVAARVAELEGGPPGYERERRLQAEWLVERLGLAA